MTADKQHWDSVYGARTEDELTWFEMTPATSLEFVKRHLRIENPRVGGSIPPPGTTFTK